MPDTFIIRLVSDELAAGRLVGIIESVRTGDAISIHDVEGLHAFLVADRRRDHAETEH